MDETDRNCEVHPDEDVSLRFEHHPYRGLSLKTVKFYDIKTRFENDVEYSRGFVYPTGAVKAKRYGDDIPRKQRYKWGNGGTVPGCFAIDRFGESEYDTIVITEGEDDAPSVYQAFGGNIAAVSVQSSSSALRDITHDRERINSFKRIVLAFDADEQGQKATKQVISSGLFDYSKLFYVDFEKHKDANAYLVAGDIADLVAEVKRAKRYTPENIINSFDDIEKALNQPKKALIGEYPTDEMNDKLYGLHRGDVIIVKGMEGIGKTELLRFCEHHLLKTTKANIAMIHMEEDKSMTIKGVATYELSIPCHLPDRAPADAEIMAAYRKAVSGSEDRAYIYTFFGGDDPDDVLDSIRFVVSAGGVDAVFLDHITLLVQSQEEGDERRKLDYLSTKLKKMAMELGFALILISHVNDEGQTRGSRNITKIANVVFNLERDLMAEDEYERNVLHVYIEKNRLSGRTGHVNDLWFNGETGKLEVH